MGKYGNSVTMLRLCTCMILETGKNSVNELVGSLDKLVGD